MNQCLWCKKKFNPRFKQRKTCSLECHRLRGNYKTKQKYYENYEVNKEKHNTQNSAWIKIHPERAKKQHKKYRLSPKGLYKSLQRRSKLKRINFKLEKEYFINWYIKQEKKCFYCGIKEDEIQKKKMCFKKSVKKLSIDKINPKLGYKKGNMVLACSRCNLIKSDFFTKNEMLKIAELVIKPKLWK